MKEFRLGILFVHGIGTQPARDTLVRWGDALLEVIGRALEVGPGRTRLIIGHADAGDRSGDKPAEVTVEFRCKGQDQRDKWLLREGWWADSFPAPTYSELVLWSFRTAPWTLALHIAQGLWQTNPNASKVARLRTAAVAIVMLLIAMALAPVFMILLVLTLMLGLLPIPELRSLIQKMQSVLVGSVGDCLAFVESPLRAALIRGRILEGLQELKGRCERTVIIAHSQGAAATLDALGGILDQDEQSEISARLESPIPDALVTFGSGVKQLVSLEVLSARRLKRKIDVNAVNTAVVATLGMIASLAILFISLRFGATSVGQLLRAFAAISVLIGVCAIAVWGANQSSRKLTAWGVLSAQPGANRVFRIVVSLTIYVAFFVLADHFVRKDFRATIKLPIFDVGFFVAVLIGFGTSVWMILSPQTRAAVTKPVQYPRGLPRWMDVYASVDPVPNGPTKVEGATAEVISVQVWNRGSLLDDHTTYWQNLDGFVLRVARLCAETAGSSWKDKLPLIADWQDRRAAWRVRLLRRLMWINWVIWALVLSCLWMRYEAQVPKLFSLPAWFGSWGPMIARSATLAIIVALTAFLTTVLLSWRWRVWVRAEQEAVIDSKSVTMRPLHGLGVVISAIGVLALVSTLDFEFQFSLLVAYPAVALLAIVLTVGAGTWIELIASWISPGPQPSSAEDDNVKPPGPA